ncbi:zinc finger protein 768-like [Ochlerotatus camptorhynchus]|uniref:zinc finger protein 768-like n=1 Tax=Ochlerotatus camptorhynchus TaxID=644619 RepID=UPI0031DDE53A
MENIVLKEAIIMANSNNMCRLCLSANGITEPICYDQRDQFLLQKIYECTTLQISPLNGIPSSLCTICKTRLDEFYQFRWQCIKNDEIIRRIADNFQKQPTDVQTSPPPTTTPPSVPSQNPKQEVIDPHPGGGEMQQVSSADGSSPSEYNAGSEERRAADGRVTPIGYGAHTEQVIGVRPESGGYSLGEHGHPSHSQYVTGPGMVSFHGEHSVEAFQSENKYPLPHQYDFSDFRRKRGRPPKQKYDQYHHPIVKYGENSIDEAKAPEPMESNAMVQEPETILTYGEGTSRSSDYQQGPVYGEWSPQAKIKVEQIDHQQVRYDEQQQQISPEVQNLKVPSTSTVQTVLTPEGFVKRSRGRPPREGGCPNQDRTEYRFQCQFCDARFKAAINLKLHTNTHTGERPYKCQLCDKSFAHPSNLSVHTKLHTQERVKREGVQSEKKFQCPYCHTLFALAFQLKIHINTHTGQKPYVCKNCGKGFAQPSNLHVHIKKHCHKRVEFHAQQGQSEHHPPPTHLPPQQLHHQQQQHLPQHYQPIHMQHHPVIPLSSQPQLPPPPPSSHHQQHSPHLQTPHTSDPSAVSHPPQHTVEHPEPVPEQPHQQLHQEHQETGPSHQGHASMAMASVMLV